MKVLSEVFKESKINDFDKFSEYMLNKLKRDGLAIALENGYIMSGDRCFIVNDDFLTKRETKDFILNYLRANSRTICR